MAGCSGHDGNHEHGVLFRNEIKTQLFPERRLPRAGTAQTGPAPTIAEGGPFRVHARLAPLSAAEQFGTWGGWGWWRGEAQSSLVSQPCQPHHLAASTTLSASSASRSPEQRLPSPGPCFTTATSPVPGWPSALLMYRHPSPFRHMGLATDDIEEGGRRLNKKLVSLGLSRTCCRALFLDFDPHAACSRSSFLPSSPALHPCEMRAIARSRDQQANLRARRGPLGNHTDTHPQLP